MSKLRDADDARYINKQAFANKFDKIKFYIYIIIICSKFNYNLHFCKID